MRKLKLNVDALRVESFAPGAHPRAEGGTVHGHLHGAQAAGTLWSCPTKGTCIGPTYCCDDTWRPSCETCPWTCPWMACGPV